MAPPHPAHSVQRHQPLTRRCDKLSRVQTLSIAEERYASAWCAMGTRRGSAVARLFTAVAALTLSVMPRSANATCSGAGLTVTAITQGYRWQGALPLGDIVILNQSNGYQTGAIGLGFVANVSGGTCKVMAQINITGVGLAQDTSYGLTCSQDSNCPIGSTQQCQNQHCLSAPTANAFSYGNVCANSPEILAAEVFGWQGELDYDLYLKVTPSSLLSVPSYPQTGTLDIIASGAGNGIDGGGSCSTCDYSYSCGYLARIPVYLEDVATIWHASAVPLS